MNRHTDIFSIYSPLRTIIFSVICILPILSNAQATDIPFDTCEGLIPAIISSELDTFSFCEDDSPDFVMVRVDQPASGSDSSIWVITDTAFNVLGTPEDPNSINFDNAGIGMCRIWLLTYQDSISELDINTNLGEITECFVLSNPITVIRSFGGPDPALISVDGEDSVSICLDGGPDFIQVFTNIQASGRNNQWLVTNDSSDIIYLDTELENLDFETLSESILYIHHITYNDNIVGLVEGQPLTEVTGCYNLSNGIVVMRNPIPTAPQISTGDSNRIEVCTGTGLSISDVNIDSLGTGQNHLWVVTDQDDNILQRAVFLEDIDLNDIATDQQQILLRYLSHNERSEILQSVNNLSQGKACVALSNPIELVFYLPPTAVQIEGAQDNSSDHIQVCTYLEEHAPQVFFNTTEGAPIPEQGLWVLTDTIDVILDFSIVLDSLDYTVRNQDTYHLYFLSYNEDLKLSKDSSLAHIEGCYSLSNALVIQINQAPPSAVVSIEGADSIVFCVDDNPSFVSIEEDSFSEEWLRTWIITDTNQIIMGITDEVSSINFDNTGVGVSLLWRIYAVDTIYHAEAGLHLDSLSGCYSLSNPIYVARIPGPTAAVITMEGATDSIVVCAGSNDPGLQSISIEDDAIGNRQQWIIIDTLGVIVSLESNLAQIDFSDLSQGTYEVRHIVYNSFVEQLETGQNIGQLEGCFALSNQLTILVRPGPIPPKIGVQGEDTVFICIDGMSDYMDIQKDTSSVGTVDVWVVTDAQGRIIELPDRIDSVDFERFGFSTSIVYAISYMDSSILLETGQNVSSLEGCYAISDPITVLGGTGPPPRAIRYSNNPSDTITFCSDSLPDFVEVEIMGASISEDHLWVITDEFQTIQGIPEDLRNINFENVPFGIYSIWYLSYQDSLMGLESGVKLADISGCYALSNGLTVVVGEQGPTAATISFTEGGDTMYKCVQDPVDSIRIHTSNIPTGEQGSWLLINDDETIGEVSRTLDDIVPLEISAGSYDLVHITYSGAVDGLFVGAQVDSLQGCFSLSNALTIVVIDAATPSAISVMGGDTVLVCATGAYQIGVDTDVATTANYSMWVLTDSVHIVQSLIRDPSEVSLSGIGLGPYYIRQIVSNRPLEGLEPGVSINALPPCIAVSNPLVIIGDTSEEVCSSAVQVINQLEKYGDIHIFPNPTKDLLFIHGDLDQSVGKMNVYLIDAGGAMVYSGTISVTEIGEFSLRIPTHSLPSGSYILSIQSKKGVFRQMIQKI